VEKDLQPFTLALADNIPDKLCHPRSDAYSAQQVPLNKQQWSFSGLLPSCIYQEACPALLIIVHTCGEGCNDDRLKIMMMIMMMIVYSQIG